MRYMVRVTREDAPGTSHAATRWTSRPMGRMKAETMKARVLSGAQAGPWGAILPSDIVAVIPEYGSVLAWAVGR